MIRQNLSLKRKNVFRGDSLSRSDVFTNSLTLSFTILQKIDIYYMSHKAKHYRVKSNSVVKVSANKEQQKAELFI